MKKIEFKGGLLTGKNAGAIAYFTEPLEDLVQIRINSCERQQMLEYVLQFEGYKNSSSSSSRPRPYTVRAYSVNKDTFDAAIKYLGDTATSLFSV